MLAYLKEMKVYICKYLKEEDSRGKEQQRESPWGKSKLDMFEEWKEDQGVWSSRQGRNGWGRLESVQQELDLVKPWRLWDRSYLDSILSAMEKN